MAEVRVVSAKDFKKPSQVSLRPIMLTRRTRPLQRPRLVGVNQPVIRPPRETVKMMSTSKRPPRSLANRSRQDALAGRPQFRPAGRPDINGKHI